MKRMVDHDTMKVMVIKLAVCLKSILQIIEYQLVKECVTVDREEVYAIKNQVAPIATSGNKGSKVMMMMRAPESLLLPMTWNLNLTE